MSNLGWTKCRVFLKNSAKVVKQYAEVNIKVFQFYWISLLCSKYFVRDCSIFFQYTYNTLYNKCYAFNKGGLNQSILLQIFLNLSYIPDQHTPTPFHISGSAHEGSAVCLVSFFSKLLCTMFMQKQPLMFKCNSAGLNRLN